MSTISRRQFLTRSWERVSSTGALRWIRPPHALAEAAFLAACDRCGACERACPHDVIFRLTDAAGPRAEGAPALDLLRKGCHLCSDFPCVAACETGALRIDEADEAPKPPVLAHCAVSEDACFAYQGPECGACADSCPVPGALNWLDGTRPVIDPARCVGCALCREACITDPKAITVHLAPEERKL